MTKGLQLIDRQGVSFGHIKCRILKVETSMC